MSLFARVRTALPRRFTSSSSSSAAPPLPPVAQLTGLPKHPSPVPALRKVYESIVAELRAMPESSTLRSSTLPTYERRLASLSSGDDNNSTALPPVVDPANDPLNQISAIGVMPIEQVLLNAEHELDLVKMMREHEVWQPLATKPADNQWTYFK